MKEPPSFSTEPESKLPLEYGLLAVIFIFFFFLLTPLGLFNDWIPPIIHKGVYSITTIDQGDDTGYYAYIRSAFFDKDFDFFNERNYAHSQKITPTGYVFNNWQIGQSILFFPFFLLGHLWAAVLNYLGYPITLDGYSFPYYMSTAWASQTYLFLGLILTYRINRRFFDSLVSLTATILVWLGTSLLYYSFVRQRMAHTTEFFLSATFIWIWINNRLSPNILIHAVLGIILGILCMARIINVALGILYIVDQISIAGWLRKNDSDTFKTLLIRLGYFSFFWLFAFSPQLLAWYKIDGIPLPALHAKIAQSESSAFSINKLLSQTKEFFWGQRWGLVFSSPIILIGLIGLHLRRSISIIKVSSTLTILGYFGVVILLFGYLDAYEYRYLSPALPLVSLGVAAILTNTLNKRYGFSLVTLFTATFIAVQYLILVQYKVIFNHNDPQFIIKALNNIPKIIFDQPSHLLRSSNLIKILNSSPQFDWTYLEFSYFLFYPLTQLVLLGIVLQALKFLINQSLNKVNTKKLVILSVCGTTLFLILIQFLTPSKSQDEIEQRMKYVNLMQKGDSLAKAGNTELALKLYTKAQNLFPNQLRPYYKKGKIFISFEQMEKAEINFRRLFKVAPDHPGTLFYLGNIMLDKGNFSQAEDFILKAIRIYPENSLFFDLLGQVYFKTNRFDLAETNYKNAISLKSDSWQAHGNLGILYYFAHKRNLAKFHLQKSIEYGNLNSSVSELAKTLKN